MIVQRTRFPRRPLLICLCMAAMIAVLHSTRNSHGLYDTWKREVVHRKFGYHVPYETLRGADDIFVILKTGANEAPEKLPAHFNTTLQYARHYGIWSDLKEEIGGYRIGDALDAMDPDVVATHPDFEYYQRLQKQGRNAFSAAELAEWAGAKNTKSGRDSPGWKLDKWKFLPLAGKAYRARPEARWYVFLECDTFVVWRNLLAWLSMLDASRAYYLGHQMRIEDITFAYGGSGIVISNPAMRALVEHHEANLQALDRFTGGHWAGDCVLGKAMLDAGIRLSFSWPTLLGDALVDLDLKSRIGPNQTPLWCYYATSYHHLSPVEVVEYNEFEREFADKNPGRLMRNGDFLRRFILPQMEAEVADWDNQSDEEHGEAAPTVAACRAACEARAGCVQFSLTGSTCRTSDALRVGHEHVRVQRVHSGWLVDRVARFADQMDAECRRAGEWILP